MTRISTRCPSLTPLCGHYFNVQPNQTFIAVWRRRFVSRRMSMCNEQSPLSAAKIGQWLPRLRWTRCVDWRLLAFTIPTAKRVEVKSRCSLVAM